MMLETGLAIASFVLSIFGFMVSAGTLVYVLARRFSTHEVRFDNSGAETRVEWNLPPTADQPPAPVSMPIDEYEKRQHLARVEASFDPDAADFDF